MSDEAIQIGADVEVIVSIAFRVRSDQYARSHGTINRYRTRTVNEIETVQGAVASSIWEGTLATIREITGQRAMAIDLDGTRAASLAAFAPRPLLSSLPDSDGGQ